MFSRKPSVRLIAVMLVLVMAVTSFPFIGTAAADTVTITVKGTDGATIATVDKEVGEKVDLLTTSGLAYKDANGKFLTFVDEAGKIYGKNITVNAAATLTATYQNIYAFYTGEKIASVTESKTHKIDATTSVVDGQNGLKYFRITSNAAAGTGFGFAFESSEQFTATADTVTRFKAITNRINTTDRMIKLQLCYNLDPYNSRQEACAYTDGFYREGENGLYNIDTVFNHTTFINAGKSNVGGYRIGPWGFKNEAAGAYCDVKYIASFDNEAIANAFSFNSYMGINAEDNDIIEDNTTSEEATSSEEQSSSTEEATSSEEESSKEIVPGIDATVVVKDTDGDTIATLSKKTADEIDLLEISELPYVNKDGKFLTFVNESGKAFGIDYTVPGDVTLTAKYQNIYAYYSGADLALASKNHKYGGLSASAVEKDGITLFRVTQTSNNSNVFTVFFPQGYTFKPTANSVTVVDCSTDFNNTGRTFLQYLYAYNDDSARTNTTEEYPDFFSKTAIDGRYYSTKSFRHTNFLAQGKTDAYGYRFAPWGGLTTTNSGYTCDVKYIATFDNQQIADAFNFEEYYTASMSLQSFDVKFTDVNGKAFTLADIAYGSTIDADDVKDAKPVDFATQYIDGDKLYVISGWKSGDTVSGLEFTVKGPSEFTAVYSEAIVLDANQLNEEALTVGVTGGTDYGTEVYAGSYKRDFLRMFDNTTGTGHHAFKLDWNLADGVSINTNTFKVGAVLSTTNAAQAEDPANNTPRQAFKIFTGKASADEGGQTSSYFNYASLKDGDVWSGLSTFELPAGITVKGVRFMPFGAQTLAATDAGYGEAVYSDIQFIGFFSNTDAAKMFDIREYKDVIDKESKLLKGDANGDGEVNTLDVVLVSRYLANWVGYEDRIYSYNADMNGDNYVTPMDAVILMREVAGWTPEEEVLDSERYYNPKPQPAANSSSTGYANYSTMTSDLLIEEIYEPLRLAHPNNITRENIGKDESGKYDMWCYTFTPDNFDPDSDEYYTVFISAGSHGMNEAQSYMGLARIMQLVWDDSQFDEELRILREKVRFVTIPLVNVWDVSERVKKTQTTYSPYNSTNTNINRNWLTDDPQQEVANIRALIYRRMDEGYKFDFGFDFHTDPEGFPGWGSYLLVYPNGVYKFFSDRLKEVCAYLDYKNFDSKGIVLKDAFRGDNLNYPQGSIHDVTANPDYPRQQNISTGSAVMWTEFGFPGATLEHGSRKFGDRVMCGSDDITAAVELYANQILQQLNYDFKDKVAYHKNSGN